MVRLRRWLLGCTVVLVAFIAGWVGYARHRALKALLQLPHLLGADIKSETDGYTYSQAVKGRTIFTIHAAKAIQHTSGKTTLRNVIVTLFGEPGTNRVDTIRGAEFEYDQTAGVVRAIGESEIDLASPATDAPQSTAAKRMQVKATGLIFDQKAGTATADGPVHFEYGGVQGMANGADFSSRTGIVLLRHDVHVTDAGRGATQQIDADNAVLDRGRRTVVLQQAILRQAGERLTARELLVQLRPDGVGEKASIESLEGAGGVEVHAANDAIATAPRMHANLSEENHPETAKLFGGVTVHTDSQQGRSDEAVLLFDGAGHPVHVQMTRAVELRQSDGSRDLMADQVDAKLGPDATGHTELEDSVASGHASLRMDDAATASPAKTTTLSADVLHAFGQSIGGQWRVQRVSGEGSTRFEERIATGERRTSTGQALEIAFAPRPAQTHAVDVSSLTQQGSVHVVDHRPAVGVRAALDTDADAQRADYQASTGLVVLTGAPTVRTDSMQVAATRIAVAHDTGDAEATGSVKGSYLASQKAGATTVPTEEPLHFTGDRVITDRAAQQATLFGAPRARIWNATSQIEAPVVEIDQLRGRMFAHGAPADRSLAIVHAVLPARARAETAAPHASAVGTVRVVSQQLRYTQASETVPGTATFTEGVRLDSSSGQLTADTATATMQATDVAKTRAMLGGTVEKVVADGHVRVQQPGRTATGERLVYTPTTQQFVLTGTQGAPPTVHDSLRGTVTGTSLLFGSTDDSVEVAGTSAEPVRTEIDAPPRQAGTSQGRRSRAAGAASNGAGQKK